MHWVSYLSNYLCVNSCRWWHHRCSQSPEELGFLKGEIKRVRFQDLLTTWRISPAGPGPSSIGEEGRCCCALWVMAVPITKGISMLLVRATTLKLIQANHLCWKPYVQLLAAVQLKLCSAEPQGLRLSYSLGCPCLQCLELTWALDAWSIGSPTAVTSQVPGSWLLDVLPPMSHLGFLLLEWSIAGEMSSGQITD